MGSGLKIYLLHSSLLLHAASDFAASGFVFARNEEKACPAMTVKYKRKRAMKFFIAAVLMFFLGGFVSSSVAQESRWGSPNEETVKFIIAAEAKWANAACGPQPDLKDIIADDFQGTSPSGRRYDKAKAITTDSKSLSRDCQLGEVKVRFFGDFIAIAYGEESSVSKGTDGKETKSCLIWTDTWLKRAGKWQIVAAQDTKIPCKP
jgi:hypothetical protein